MAGGSECPGIPPATSQGFSEKKAPQEVKILRVVIKTVSP
jgi:hypothetical protein